MSDEDGLMHAYVLDGAGGGRRVEWAEIQAWRPGSGALWVHVDRSVAHIQQWLADESGLEPLIVRALIAEETRPRFALTSAGLLVILRGANHNPGAQPEDMVSLRTWVDADRVITVRRRRLKAVLDVQDSLEEGTGPRGAGGLLVALIERLAERMVPVVQRLDAAVDHLEVAALDAAEETTRSELVGVRRRTIALRRYITPQRDAIISLCGARTPLLGDPERARLRECADRVTRYVEDLDALRERAAVTNDEIHSRLAETMNRRMYLLSLVAAIFLPLGLITGLLGVNVGGIPGKDNNLGFWVVTVLLVTLGAGAAWLFRRRRLF